MTRIPSLLVCLLLLAAPAVAENRVEGLSTRSGGEMLAPDLVEIDLMKKGSLGFRATDLGRRDTHEFYVRMSKGEESRPLDPRDQRSQSKGSLFSASGFHVGLAGVDVDGTRGNPQSLRLGIFTNRRLADKVMGVSEMMYQTGTFGGHADRQQNKGGLYSRVGARMKFGRGWYGVTQYTFAPGRDEKWLPEVRVGMSF